MELMPPHSAEVRYAITILRTAFPNLLLAGRTDGGQLLCECQGDLMVMLGLAEAVKHFMVETATQQQQLHQTATQQQQLHQTDTKENTNGAKSH